jgi:hypothetical protein
MTDWPGPGSQGPTDEPSRPGRSRSDVVLVVVAVASGIVALLVPSPQERRLVVGALLVVCAVCVALLAISHRERRKAAKASAADAGPADLAEGPPDEDGPPDPDGREPWG